MNGAEFNLMQSVPNKSLEFKHQANTHRLRSLQTIQIRHKSKKDDLRRVCHPQYARRQNNRSIRNDPSEMIWNNDGRVFSHFYVTSAVRLP